MWERWDSYSHIAGFGDAEMNSFNHYAYGAIGEWLYRNIAGIQPDAPGYKQIRIAPEPDARFSFVKAHYETPYGLVRVEWNLSGNQLILCGEIPFNTSAQVIVPRGFEVCLLQGASVRQESDRGLQLGSGTFRLDCLAAGCGESPSIEGSMQGEEVCL
jgi:alpha-L-rhamnosidase